jgi:hypothetical protein
MLRSIAASIAILFCISPAGWAQPQRDSNSLQSGLPVTRTLSRGQSLGSPWRWSRVSLSHGGPAQHRCVIVRKCSPQMANPPKSDSPNGANGRRLSVVGITPGTFSVEVTPLLRTDSVLPGSFEIQ